MDLIKLLGDIAVNKREILMYRIDTNIFLANDVNTNFAISLQNL